MSRAATDISPKLAASGGSFLGLGQLLPLMNEAMMGFNNWALGGFFSAGAIESGNQFFIGVASVVVGYMVRDDV